MFWGQIPIFPPERSISFFKKCDKLIEESFQRKKSGCHPSNNRFLTQKTPPKCRKTQFSSTLYQIEFAESGFETLKIFFWWNLAKRMSFLWFLWANWCSTGIFGVQYPFFGRLHPFFLSEYKPQLILSKHLKKKDFLGEKMGIWP